MSIYGLHIRKLDLFSLFVYLFLFSFFLCHRASYFPLISPDFFVIVPLIFPHFPPISLSSCLLFSLIFPRFLCSMQLLNMQIYICRKLQQQSMRKSGTRSRSRSYRRTSMTGRARISRTPAHCFCMRGL